MKYDWPGRFFQGRLILWYFQFPAGINQSRVADQFPVQGDDLGHGAAVLSGDFPEGVALSDDVYPTFLILRQNSIGSAACDRRSALGNLKLPAGVNPVRVLDPVTVGCHDLGYGAVVFSGDCPESVTCLYGIGHIGGGVFHDRRGILTVSLFLGAAVSTFLFGVSIHIIVELQSHDILQTADLLQRSAGGGDCRIVGKAFIGFRRCCDGITCLPCGMFCFRQ